MPTRIPTNIPPTTSLGGKGKPPVEKDFDNIVEFYTVDTESADLGTVINAFGFHLAVDEFARSMCGYFKDDASRRKKAIYLMDTIFSIRKGGSRFPLMGPAIRFSKDGGYVGGYGVAVVVRNLTATYDMTPEDELVGRFSEALAKGTKDVIGGFGAWNIPAFGIIIIGSDISIYALRNFGTYVYIKNFVPAISCDSSRSEECDKLYHAFWILPAFQAELLQDMSRNRHLEAVPENDNVQFPPVFKLCRWGSATRIVNDSIEIRIEKTLDTSHPDRAVYLARYAEKIILVKFVRRYCPELHGLCVELGRAPALIAYEALPGGWYGVAMEYLEDAVPIVRHRRIAEYIDGWEHDIRELVKKIHERGFVHGDLRERNFVSGNDGCVKLVDFDWGSKVSYSKEGSKTTKAEDGRILESTLRYFRSGL